MKFIFPKDFSYEKTLEELDEEQLRAKIMVSIFKELEERQSKNPEECPWCKQKKSNS